MSKEESIAQPLGEYAYSVKLSSEAKYLVANLYNGDIIVYELPEPSKPNLHETNDSNLKNKNNNNNNNNISNNISNNNYETESLLIQPV